MLEAADAADGIDSPTPEAVVELMTTAAFEGPEKGNVEVEVEAEAEEEDKDEEEEEEKEEKASATSFPSSSEDTVLPMSSSSNPSRASAEEDVALTQRPAITRSSFLRCRVLLRNTWR